MNYSVLIPAAGVGSRFGAAVPKQYSVLAGKCVLQHTLDLFAANARIGAVAVVVSPADEWFERCIRLPENGILLRVGGESRAESVRNGLTAWLADGLAQNARVLVHDAARCCLPQSALNRLLDQAGQSEEGGILALPVSDTLKRQNAAAAISCTVPREGLWQAQTPQLFQAALLHRALQGNLDGITDEASAIERLGFAPRLVEGDSRNIKLTRAADAPFAEWLLAQARD